MQQRIFPLVLWYQMKLIYCGKPYWNDINLLAYFIPNNKLEIN
jgi:hypothetical protein